MNKREPKAIVLVVAALCALSLVGSATGQITVANLTTSCSKTTMYYDTSQFQCLTCPENMVPTSDKLGCTCDVGFYIDNATIDDFLPTCLPCGDQQGATQDKSQCLPCSGNATYSSTVKDCICPLNERIVEQHDNGTFLSAKTCASCLSTSYQGPNNRPIYSCDTCQVEGQLYSTTIIPWQCACQQSFYTTSGDTCIINTDLAAVRSSYPLENARTVNYDYVETRSTTTLSQVTVVMSDTYNYLYYEAAVGCQEYRDPKMCQTLANLCVLQMYSERTIVCSLYQNIVDTLVTTKANSFYNDAGWKEGFPWLYYQRSSGDVMYQPKRLKMRVSFGYENAKIGILNKLTYKLAKFDLEGNFYGFETLTNQLQVCETSTDEITRLMKFGTTIENSCTFDLSSLTSSNPEDHPANANMFYELYIEDYNGDLIDVPVMIRNFYDKNGDTPNSADQSDDNKWRLARRFFMFDSVSGIEGQGAYAKGGISTVIRYPKSITLRIKLDPDNDEMIYTPLLIIEYRERSKTIIESNSLTDVTFVAEYAMDTSSFWNTTKILFIILNVFFVILLIIQMVVWCQTPQLSEDASAQCKYAVVKVAIAAFDLYSYIFFWFLVALTGYWFIFFKMQERVYILLPALNTYEENYKNYDILFGVVAGTKLLTIIYKICFEQCSFDIFLIDWERPKLPYEHNGTEKLGVNAWRSLFLMNEINELQLYKMISIEFTLVAYALVMEGLGCKYFSTHSPEITTHQYSSPENYPLMFFITTICIYAIGVAQYALRFIVKFRVPLKVEELTDLCSICNISILMFDNSFHGFYIHGRSPYGQAEVSCETLRKSIEYESSGKAQQRGLIADEPSLQTFEIYMPKRMLQDYKDHYLKDVNQEILKQNNDNTKRFNAVEVMLTKSNAVPKNLDLELLEDQRNFMNMIMQTYIEQVKIEPKKYIQDRSALQRLFNLPSTIVNKGIPIMFRDKWMNFQSLFLSGMDFDFLMLDVITISFINMAARNDANLQSRVMLGILIAYILDSGLLWLRSYLGRRNLSQHTLADERFLI